MAGFFILPPYSDFISLKPGYSKVDRPSPPGEG